MLRNPSLFLISVDGYFHLGSLDRLHFFLQFQLTNQFIGTRQVKVTRMASLVQYVVEEYNKVWGLRGW